MNMPAMLQGESLTRLGQGAAFGAVATIAIGFGWGGWTLASTAENNAVRRVNVALVEAYAPVCVERFQQQVNAESKWTEFGKVDAWRRDDYIKQTGFATPPGAASPNDRVADACAQALVKIIATKPAGAK